MTPLEYIQRHAKEINNHINIGPIEKAEGPFCVTCFRAGDIEKAEWNQQRFGWVCPHGHFGKSEKLASGVVTHGPR